MRIFRTGAKNISWYLNYRCTCPSQLYFEVMNLTNKTREFRRWCWVYCVAGSGFRYRAQTVTSLRETNIFLIFFSQRQLWVRQNLGSILIFASCVIRLSIYHSVVWSKKSKWPVHFFLNHNTSGWAYDSPMIKECRTNSMQWRPIVKAQSPDLVLAWVYWCGRRNTIIASFLGTPWSVTEHCAQLLLLLYYNSSKVRIIICRAIFCAININLRRIRPA